jgi:hypothetical protein
LQIKKQVKKLRLKYPLLKSKREYGRIREVLGTLKAVAVYQNIEYYCQYDIKICIPRNYPLTIPLVFETGGKIDKNFHRNPNGALCLASPAELKLKFNRSKTLINFVDNLVIPFLFSHKHFIETGRMPYGELAHGSAGIYQYYCEYFNTDDPRIITEYLSCLLEVHDNTNNRPCPCGSGKSISNCHKDKLNYFRQSLSSKELNNIVSEGRQAVANVIMSQKQNIDKVVRELFPKKY